MKLIDWAKVPRGTCVEWKETSRQASPVFNGEIVSHDHERSRTYILTMNEYGLPWLYPVPRERLRIVPATRWTYHDGGECPVPEWVTCAVIYAAGRMPNNPPQIGGWMNTIAYRITGVDRAGGFTDDPSEVTE